MTSHGGSSRWKAVGVSGPGGFDTVLVVDFGAQYAQLIARRVRECHVYSEIVPSTMPAEQMLAKQPKAIILSGGPASVYAPGAPPAPAGLLAAGVPMLGICYGFQLMVTGLGGTVERTGAAEYGATTLASSRAGCRTATRAPWPRPASRSRRGPPRRRWRRWRTSSAACSGSSSTPRSCTPSTA